MTKIMLQLHGSRSSSARLHNSNKWTNVWVVPRVLQAFDKEDDARKFQPIHERQKMEKMELGFVAQEIITKVQYSIAIRKFWGANFHQKMRP